MQRDISETQVWLKEFDAILRKTDSSIDEVNWNGQADQGYKQIKEINEWIVHASSILTKIYDWDNKEFNEHSAFFNKKYLEWAERRKILQGLKKELNTKIWSYLDNRGNDENTETANVYDKQVSVNLRSDYNERLLQGSLANWYEVNNNLEETAIGLHQQRGKWNNINDNMDKGEEGVKENGNWWSSIDNSSKCKTLWMILVNALMFIVIILMIMLKILNLFK